MSEDKLPKSCADCSALTKTLEIRNRSLCTDCFIRYVNSKVLKRMESYRLKNWSNEHKMKLLLPLSGGVSSLALLQILDLQLQKQIVNQNRTAYDLVIVNVASADHSQEALTGWYTQIAEQFPLHVYLPPMKLDQAFSIDLDLKDDMRALNVEIMDSEDDQKLLNRISSSITTATSRSDLQSILLLRLLVACGKQNKCDSIIWGHSDSRLAAQVLADVAKGRGSSVSSTISDGPSIHGVGFNYPLRDLSQTEIQLYASVHPQRLSPLTKDSSESRASATSIRNTSIDKLLSTYIRSQAERYPSIMANVVKTTGKLEGQVPDPTGLNCAICKMSIDGVHVTDNLLCYGCIRTKQDIKSTIV